MQTKVFINLPVEDLGRSRAFFERLGFSFDDTFCDDTALAMTISEACFAMLLTREKFATFTPKPIADAHESSEVLNALQLESRAAVREPEDHGFMYGHAFADPDGHIWEPFWMNPDAVRTEPTATEEA